MTTPPPAISAVSEAELQRIHGELHLSRIHSLINNHVIAALLLGLIPVPMVDLLGLSGIHLRLIQQLCRHYRRPFSQHRAVALRTALVGGAIPVGTTMGASLVKLIPGIGTLTGATSVAVLGGATTYALGHTLVQHFDAGGSLEDADLSRLRVAFRQAMGEGQRVTEHLQRDGVGAGSRSPQA